MEKIICTILFLICCAPRITYKPEPERDVKDWVKNLALQKSFSYEYEMKTSTVKITAVGDCIVDWAEHIFGKWYYGDTVINFEYIGINDREWTKKGRKWEESARGEESNVFAQIKRILEFEKFELISQRGKFIFKSNATLPFLCPERWREMFGYVEISRDSYLPELIWVGLPDSSSFLQVKIKDYNHNKIIRPPYLEYNEYEVRCDSINKVRALKGIRGRLLALNQGWKLKMIDHKIILEVPNIYSKSDVEEYLAPGIIRIYETTQKNEEGVSIRYLNNNINKPVYLTKTNFSREIIKDISLGFNHISKPFLQITFKKSIGPLNGIAIEVDSNIVFAQALDNVKKLDKIILYSDMNYNELIKLKALLKRPLFKMEIIPLTKGSD
uniref:Uncharacterized protein n=1 Tax=candidate division WOR-3 bacterium TaxID=2052148 RepID=A0A7V3VUT6_UNCW3